MPVLGHLQAGGVRATDVVGLAMGSSALHLVVALALARLEAPSLSLNPLLPAGQREDIITRYGVRYVVRDLDAQQAGDSGCSVQCLAAGPGCCSRCRARPLPTTVA